MFLRRYSITPRGPSVVASHLPLARLLPALTSSATWAQSARHCASSGTAPLPAATMRRLLELVCPCLPRGGAWVPLSAIARQVPDEFFDEWEHAGGLRAFLDACNRRLDVDPDVAFDLRTEPSGALVVRLRASGGPQGASGSTEAGIPGAPPPPPPGARAEQQKVPQFHPTTPAAAVQPVVAHRAPPQDAARVALMSVPTFMVPLSAACALWLSDAAASTSAPGSTTSGEPDAAPPPPTEEQLQAYARFLRPYASFVDLVLPAPLADVWPICCGEKPSAAGITLGAHAYIALLPPFHQSHGNVDTNNELDAHEARAYDLFRFARFVNTNSFVLLRSLVPATENVVTRELLHIVASNPNYFEYLPPNADGVEPTVAPDGSLVRTFREAASGADGLPSLSASPTAPPPKGTVPNSDVSGLLVNNNTGASTFIAESAASEAHAPTAVAEELPPGPALGAVRFLLSQAEWSNTLGGVPVAIQSLTLDQLRKLFRALHRRQPLPEAEAIAEAKELGLSKPVPFNIRRVKLKHQTLRAILMKRFPKGNVFMDRAVLAHYIFDTIPQNEAVEVNAYRLAYLPEAGRTVAPMSSQFLMEYPHLWSAYQDDRNEWWIQRSDATHKITVRKSEDITADEIIRILFQHAPGGNKFDPTRPTSYSTMTQYLSVLARDAVKRMGGFNRVMSTRPDLFKPDVGRESFLWVSRRYIPLDGADAATLPSSLSSSSSSSPQSASSPASAPASAWDDAAAATAMAADAPPPPPPPSAA